MFGRILSRVFVVTVLLFASFLFIAAQDLDDVTVSGMVTDSNGLAVVGASVTVTSVETGEVRIVTMFYSSCPYACPLIVETIKAVEAALPAAERLRLKVDMVSFDHDRDTPAQLKKVVAQRSIISGLMPDHWLLTVLASAAIVGDRPRSSAHTDI